MTAPTSSRNGVLLEHLHQDALGHHQKPRLRPRPALEADLIADPRRQQRRRHAGRLPGAGRRDEHGRGTGPQSRDQLGQDVIDREGRRQRSGSGSCTSSA